MVDFTTLVTDHSQSREETRETGQMWSILFVTSFSSPRQDPFTYWAWCQKYTLVRNSAQDLARKAGRKICRWGSRYTRREWPDEGRLCGEGRREASKKPAHASVHPGKEGWQHGHSRAGVDATVYWRSPIFLAYSSSSSSEAWLFLLSHWLAHSGCRRWSPSWRSAVCGHWPHLHSPFSVSIRHM